MHVTGRKHWHRWSRLATVTTAGTLVLGLGTGTALAAAHNAGAAHGSVRASTKSAKAHTPKVAVDLTSVSKYGKILVDQKGFALYFDSADKPPKKWPCKGACLTVWPPLVLPKGQNKPVAGKGVTGLGVVKGPSGKQVTWHGKPLYTFVRDQKGSVRGQGIVQDGKWLVTSLAGTKTKSKSGTTGTTKPKSTWA